LSVKYRPAIELSIGPTSLRLIVPALIISRMNQGYFRDELIAAAPLVMLLAVAAGAALGVAVGAIRRALKRGAHA
jgi:hypothetical protein